MSTRRNANVDRSHRDGRGRNFLRTTGVRLRRVFFSCVTARREDTTEPDNRPAARQEGTTDRRQAAAAQPQQTEQTTSEQTHGDTGAAANDQLMLPVEADPEPLVRQDRTREYVAEQQIHPWQQQHTETTASGDTTTTDDEPDYDGGAEEEEERWEAGSAGSLETHLPDRPDLETVQEAGHRGRLVRALRPVQASVSYGSQIGQVREQASTTGDSSQTRSVKGQAVAKMSIPSGSARSAADSDPRAPVPVEGALEPGEDGALEPGEDGALEPGEDGALEGAVNSRTRDAPFEADEGTYIIGLAYQRQTDRVYLLMKSNTGIQLCKMMTQGGWEIDLSLRVHDEPFAGDQDADIAASGDFIVVRIKAKMTAFDQHVVKVSELSQTLDDIKDITGTNDSVYCLLSNGDVVEYRVPQLERVRVITPPEQTPGYPAGKIAFCPDTRRVAISTYVADLYPVFVNIFDEDWKLYVTVLVSSEFRSVDALCLSRDELVVSGETTQYRPVYCINYASSVAAQTYSRRLYPRAIYFMEEDQILVASLHDIRRVNLRELRQKMTPYHRSDGIITVIRNDLPLVKVTQDIEYSTSRNDKIRSLALNKASGELMKINENGEVAVYGRDISRPLHTFTLPIPDGAEVSRFDATEEGEVVAISDEGKLMIFSPVGQLSWSTDLGEAAGDVVCNGDSIYVLLQDEIAILTLYTHEGRRRTKQSRRLPLFRDRNEVSGCLRLAVHKQLMYIRDRNRIFRMDLTDPIPSWTLFIDEPRLKLCGLAVTGEGELVVGGRWEARNYRDSDSVLASIFASWSGYLVIFSPDGKLRRRVKIPDPVHNLIDLVPRPGGGIYYRSISELHFLEDF